MTDNNLLETYLTDIQPFETTNILNQNLKYPSNQPLIYSWGKNKDGELGQATNKNSNVPQPVKLSKNTYPVFISLGGSHSGVVSSDGKIYVCGSSLHFKLGIEDIQVTCITKLHQIPVLNNMQLQIQSVACGEYHSLCLTETGQVYTWGGTLHKKLGQRANKPSIVTSLINKKIIYVGCGDFHSAALTDNGELYTWGGGGSKFNKGQLGHGHLNDVENPQKVKFFENMQVKKVSCGGYHMMAITNSDEVYGWGSGLYGECGIGEYSDALQPKLVKINFNLKLIQTDDFEFLSVNKQDLKVVDIALGGHHSLLLSNFGHVYSCGYGSLGQLGLKNITNQNEPQFIYQLSNKKIIQIAAGWNHSIVLTDQYDVYTCGHGLYGQLGLGNDESKTRFTQVKSLAGKNVKQIYGGGNHSWAVLDQFDPICQNYTPASPLRQYDTCTPILSRSRDISPLKATSKSPMTTKIVSENFGSNSEKFVKIDQDKILQILYSDYDLSHRFAKFQIRESEIQQKGLQRQVDEYIRELSNFEQKIRLHQLTRDSKIIEQMDGKENIIQNNQDGYISYTLMIVSDLREQGILTNIIPNSNKNISFDVQSTLVGEMHFIKYIDILKDHNQKILCNWMVLFEKKFSGFIDNVKYLELRPKNLQDMI